MNRYRRVRRLLLGLLLMNAAPAFAACVDPGGGIGGTGLIAPGGGIGGTGQAVESVGIVGTITGFGSVCVNGLKIGFDAQTPVEINRVPADVTRLATGQVIAIEADWTASPPTARNIHVIHQVEGPITASAVAAGMIQVMRQPVRVDAETYLGGVKALTELTTGRHVRVSGFRNALDEIIATRVEVSDGDGTASVIGRIRADGSIAGLNVELNQTPEAGALELLARGRWDGQRLIDATSHGRPALPFSERVRQVVVEGLLLGTPGTDALGLGGFELAPGDDAAIDTAGLQIGERVVLSGRLDARGRITPLAIERADHAIERTGGRTPVASGGGPPRPPATQESRAAGEHEGPGDRERTDRGPRDGMRIEDHRPNQRAIGDRIERPERVERPERQGR